MRVDLLTFDVMLVLILLLDYFLITRNGTVQKDLLLARNSRGLEHASALAMEDDALGFWQALRRVYGQTRWQRLLGP